MKVRPNRKNLNEKMLSMKETSRTMMMRTQTLSSKQTLRCTKPRGGPTSTFQDTTKYAAVIVSIGDVDAFNRHFFFLFSNSNCKTKTIFPFSKITQKSSMKETFSLENVSLSMVLVQQSNCWY